MVYETHMTWSQKASQFLSKETFGFSLLFH